MSNDSHARTNRKFGSGFFGGALTGSQWTAEITDESLIVSVNGRLIVYPFERLHGINSSNGITWADIYIQSPSGNLHLDGISNNDGKNFVFETRHLARLYLHERGKTYLKHVGKIEQALKSLLEIPGYLRRSSVDAWLRGSAGGLTTQEMEALAMFAHPLFPMEKNESGCSIKLSRVLPLIRGDLSLVHERNEIFVQAEIDRLARFFDEVESTPLTVEQRRACVVNDDRNLLVAAAGSGKTSCVVVKIGYCLITGIARPHEILALAFAKEAAGELEERVSKRLATHIGGEPVKVKTFHSLGLEIIGAASGSVPTLASFAADPLASLRLFTEIIDELKQSPDFHANLLLYTALYLRQAKNPANFQTIREWNDYVYLTGQSDGNRRGYRTINGELVKSQGELAIANWLFMQGISYIYEAPYEYDTADEKHRQYHPDFYFPDINTYLEHYALDEHGNPPPAFGNKYRDSMEWKQALHEAMDTQVMETTFHEFESGTLFDRLETELKARGTIFSPRSLAEKEERIKAVYSFAHNNLISFMSVFVKHAKSNRIKPEALRASTQSGRARIFVLLAAAVLDAYECKLKAMKAIDFEDMILMSTDHVLANQYKHPYKMILVDEFQDISSARAALVKAMLIQNPDCLLFSVGDDWQSIFRFAGSDVGFFSNFDNYFGSSATNYLTKTFRSNRGISDTASTFVQKNENQQKKKVHSVDPNMDKVITVRTYEAEANLESTILSCLKEIQKDRAATDIGSRVFILGRYRNQVSGESIRTWKRKLSLDIEYKNVHTSKGLQADYVVLAGLQGGNKGFPSEVVDDPLLGIVMPYPDRYPYAEERRLLYVALTRAKHKVFLVANSSRPSPFLIEILSWKDFEHVLDIPDNLDPVTGRIMPKNSTGLMCPTCGGHLVKRKGKFGEFIGCSNYPDCLHKQRIDEQRGGHP